MKLILKRKFHQEIKSQWLLTNLKCILHNVMGVYTYTRKITHSMEYVRHAFRSVWQNVILSDPVQKPSMNVWLQTKPKTRTNLTNGLLFSKILFFTDWKLTDHNLSRGPDGRKDCTQETFNLWGLIRISIKTTEFNYRLASLS